MDTTQENPNSPDNLLGNWLRSNISNMRDRGHGPMEEVADLLLSHILDFSDDHIDAFLLLMISTDGLQGTGLSRLLLDRRETAHVLARGLWRLGW
jgi:hypothetical protein